MSWFQSLWHIIIDTVAFFLLFVIGLEVGKRIKMSELAKDFFGVMVWIWPFFAFILLDKLGLFPFNSPAIPFFAIVGYWVILFGYLIRDEKKRKKLARED